MALEDWDESRALEAGALEKDLLTRLLRMEEWVQCIRDRAPTVKEERFTLVRERIAEALERHGQDLDEGRFLQEIVLLADKLDVSEELTRLAVHLDRLRELLAQGAEVNAKANSGVTALMAASENGHLDVVRELLAQGADVHAKTNKGATALRAAARNKHDKVRDLLVGSGAK